MTHQLSPHDYELLSAYLDGQLPGRDRDKVEYRVRTYPEWRTGLEDLQFSRRMLRSLPRRRAPRNFTLKPSMVQATPARRFYPVFRLVAALASVLLVITFASDLALNLTAQRLPMLAAPTTSAGEAATELSLPSESPLPSYDSGSRTSKGPEATSALQGAAPLAPAAPSPSQETTTAPLAANLAPGIDETATAIVAQTNAPPGKGGGEPEGTNTAESTPEVEVAPFPTSTPEPAIGSLSIGPNETPTLPPSGMGGGPSPETPKLEQPANSPTLAPTSTPEIPASTGPRASVTLNPRAAPLPTQSFAAQAEPATPPPAETTPGERITNLDHQTKPLSPQPDYEPTLRKLEIILAIVAVLTGIAAIILRSRLNG